MTNAFQCDYTLLTANDDGQRADQPRVIYLHTFEGRDLDAGAMATYQLSPAAGGSYALVIDVDGQTARENDDDYISWSAGWTANRNGHHICVAGQAAFTREEWLARTKQMDKLVEVITAYCRAYGYPPIIRLAGDLAAGKWGISTHAAAAEAWRETDHTDPGVGFPLDVIASRVEQALNASVPAEPATPDAVPQPIQPGGKYASYIDGRELRFSEYLRYIDEKVTRLFDHFYPNGGETFAVDIAADRVGPEYPSYADNSKAFTLDQFVRLVDYKVDHIARKVLP